MKNNKTQISVFDSYWRENRNSHIRNVEGHVKYMANTVQSIHSCHSSRTARLNPCDTPGIVAVIHRIKRQWQKEIFTTYDDNNSGKNSVQRAGVVNESQQDVRPPDIFLSL